VHGLPAGCPMAATADLARAATGLDTAAWLGSGPGMGAGALGLGVLAP